MLTILVLIILIAFCKPSLWPTFLWRRLSALWMRDRVRIRVFLLKKRHVFRVLDDTRSGWQSKQFNLHWQRNGAIKKGILADGFSNLLTFALKREPWFPIRTESSLLVSFSMLHRLSWSRCIFFLGHDHLFTLRLSFSFLSVAELCAHVISSYCRIDRIGYDSF